MNNLQYRCLEVWEAHRIANLEADIRDIDKKIEVMVESLAELQNTKNQKNLEIRNIEHLLKRLRPPERLK